VVRSAWAGYGNTMSDDALIPDDPEQRLALAYVPRERRAALACLWQLDARLGRVVESTTEPAIGAIRLAWWRDALARLEAGPVPPEPLLRGAATLLLPAVHGMDLAELANAWGLLFDRPLEQAQVEEYGRERGARLFRLSALVLGADEVLANAGAGWALAELAFSTRDRVLRAQALGAARSAFGSWNGRSPSRLRPLGMLAVLARLDAAAGLDQPRRQGSPGRIARMVAHRLANI